MKLEIRIEIENQEDLDEGLEGLRNFIRQEVEYALVSLLEDLEGRLAKNNQKTKPH
jgi:hypothetical protein|tara:strand:+ start:5002 stop:5169 length:168 start_codon:yes stop_codon:yes gene_type:complete